MKAENERLKEEVEELRKRLRGSETKSENADSTVTTSRLSGLLDKLKMAEEQAKAARESSLSVAIVADRWKEQLGGKVSLYRISVFDDQACNDSFLQLPIQLF